MNVLENTTVIFIGDNGTDAASIETPFSTNPDSHKMEVYEGGIRVLFIVADGYHLEHGIEAPSSTGVGYISSPGRREYMMVNTVDIFATIAGIAGVASTAEDSVSLLRFMGNNPLLPRIPRQFMYTDRCSNQMFQAAIRDSSYKLVYRLNFALGTPVIELYDVTDLAESVNLYGTGITAEAILEAEMDSMWLSEGYDPLAAAACP